MFSLSDLSILVEHVTPGLNRKRLYIRPLQFAFACTYLEKRLNAIKICNFDPGKHKLADFHAMDPGLKVCNQRGVNSIRFASTQQPSLRNLLYGEIKLISYKIGHKAKSKRGFPEFPYIAN